MKYVCNHAAILRGEVVRPGRVLNLSPSEADLPVVRRHFSPVEGGGDMQAQSAGGGGGESTAPSAFIAGLTREQALLKLRGVGVKVPPNTGDGRIRDLYNETFSTISEKAGKAETGQDGLKTAGRCD